MSSELSLDAAGRRRSSAAMPGHHAGHAPKNKGQVYPADPPPVAVMRQTSPDRHDLRLRALVVVLWRDGLRIPEALSLIESDLGGVRRRSARRISSAVPTRTNSRATRRPVVAS